MGSEGTRPGISGDLVLDAGALIAFERGDEVVKSILRRAVALEAQVVVPATVLAQVWRGGPQAAPLARLAKAVDVDALDEERAREVGVRSAECGASDVADAHVVCCALSHRAAVATADPGDMRALAKAPEALKLIPV